MTPDPFTGDQEKRIDQLADKRDVRTQRESSLSSGEQGKIDKTADLLADKAAIEAESIGFNATQQEQLDAEAEVRDVKHQADLKKVVKHRWLPVAGYLALTLGMAYSVQTARDAGIKASHEAKVQAIQHSNQNRVQALAVTRVTIRSNCESSNQLRSILRVILQERVPSISKQVAAHQLTPSQAKTELQFIQNDIHLLAAKDCNALVAAVK